ncbi:MAG: hypothetical protein JWQ70_2968, partial [Aeromicrobium sp.]|nr:hypothetical protein [Aeromicrobium sp.]
MKHLDTPSVVSTPDETGHRA